MLEILIRLTLAVEMRHFVFAVQGRHAVIIERHPFAGIFQRRPDDMLEPRCLGGFRHRLGLRDFFLRRKVLPEIRYAKSSVSSCEGLFQALRVIHIRADNFDAEIGQRLGFVRIHIAGDCPHREFTRLIACNCAHESAALGAGRADDGNDLLVCHH